MKIDFEFETQYGKYADALIFPDDQPLPPEAEIEAMKLHRLDHWIVFITTDHPSLDDEII